MNKSSVWKTCNGGWSWKREKLMENGTSRKPRFFVHGISWEHGKSGGVDNTTLTLEECTGERVCARRLRYICILVHSPGESGSEPRWKRDHQTFRSLNLASDSRTFTSVKRPLRIFSQIRWIEHGRIMNEQPTNRVLDSAIFYSN